jgi:hypothetical protein
VKFDARGERAGDDLGSVLELTPERGGTVASHAPRAGDWTTHRLEAGRWEPVQDARP